MRNVPNWLHLGLDQTHTHTQLSSVNIGHSASGDGHQREAGNRVDVRVRAGRHHGAAARQC